MSFRVLHVDLEKCDKKCPANTEGEWCNLVQDHLGENQPDFPFCCPLKEIMKESSHE